MAEIVTTPLAAQNKTYEVKEIYLNWDTQYIKIVLQDSNGARPAFEFSGDVSVNMMKILNTANLTNNSLHKRILTFLLSNGLIAGTISGVPS